MSRHLRRLEKGRSVADKVSQVLGKDGGGLLEEASSSGEDVQYGGPSHYLMAKKKKKKKKPDDDAIPIPPTSSTPQTHHKPKKAKRQTASSPEPEPEHLESLEEMEAMLDGTLTPAPSQPEEAAPEPSFPSLNELFTLSVHSLDAQLELKQMFGAGVAAMEEQERNQRARRLVHQHTKSILVTPDPTWPPVSTKGLSITKGRVDDSYTYSVHELEEEGECLKVTKAVKASLVSDDVNRLQMLMQRHPWHLRACYQYGVMACLNGRQDEGAGVFRRAAHAFALSCRGTLSLVESFEKRVFPYVKEKSDVAFLLLQQLMHLHVRSGCLNTAFGVCKLIFNLDPTDPCGILFNLEYLALRAGAFDFLRGLFYHVEKDTLCTGDIALLPIFHFGRTLCAIHSNNVPGAKGFLQTAVLTYPLLALSLLKEDDRGELSAVTTQLAYRSSALHDNIANCYAKRMEETWRERRAYTLLKTVVSEVCQQAGVYEVMDGRGRERDSLLGGAFYARWYAEVRPMAVIGVVDEIMPGREMERVRLQRAWSASLNALPTAVQHMVLDRLADHDYSLLQRTPWPLLALTTLLPWNSLPLMLSRRLLDSWRKDNPTEADEWDTDMEVQRRLRARGLA